MTDQKRLKLHEELCEILGSRNVYFQPPESVKLVYPCIIYKRQSIEIRKADDSVFINRRRYLVTVIDRDPDSEILDKIIKHFLMCDPDRHFTTDNLNHDTFIITY